MIQPKQKSQAQNLLLLFVFLGQTISSKSLVTLCTKLNEATVSCFSTEALNKHLNENAACLNFVTQQNQKTITIKLIIFLLKNYIF